MGSQVKIGDRVFNAIGKGRLMQEQSVRALTRISTDGFSENMASIVGSATANLLFDVIKGTSLILIKKVIADAIFLDSSTGALYNICSEAVVSVVGTYLVNKDNANAPTFPINLSSDNLELLVQVDSNSQVNLSCVIYGGSIVAKTAITPGAGDTVAGGVSIIYEPVG